MKDQAFLSQVKGFTPVIDVLANEHGSMTALVYGIAWRYCQLEDKVCRASKETIGRHAGISPKTVQRHLHILVEAGYLEDTTPDQKHKPHVYRDTGKAQIIGLVEARIVGRSESPTSEVGRSESPTSQDTESYLGRTESPVKREGGKKEKEKKEKDSPPTATDNHQSIIDKANGSTTDDPVTTIAQHLHAGFMGAPVPLPKTKRGKKKWVEAARRLASKLPPGWDLRRVCYAIDEWWTRPDDFWKDKPCKDETIDLIVQNYNRLAKRQPAPIPTPQPSEPDPAHVQEWDAAVTGPLSPQFDSLLRLTDAIRYDNGSIVVACEDERHLSQCQHRQAHIEDRAGLSVQFVMKGEVT